MTNGAQSKTISVEKLWSFCEFARSLALESGQLMHDYESYEGEIPSQFKYINIFVANIIEDMIIKRIQKEYPEHNIYSDKTKDRNTDFEWICDYIDGAYCYSKKHHVSVVSIALTYRQRTIVAVIYNPWTKTLYSALKNEGFYVNKKQYKLPAASKLSGSLIDVEWWNTADYDVDSWMHNFSIAEDVYALHMGSVIHAACLVANGVFGAAILGKYMVGKNHELAAISLIIEEAGGIVSDLYNTQPFTANAMQGLIFSNKSIHKKLVDSYARYANR